MDVKAWSVGFDQHTILRGPNSGWSEAGTAGAMRRRIVGPIWLRGELVTDVWIGHPGDPPLSSGQDVVRAMLLASVAASGWSRSLFPPLFGCGALILAFGQR